MTTPPIRNLNQAEPGQITATPIGVLNRLGIRKLVDRNVKPIGRAPKGRGRRG